MIDEKKLIEDLIKRKELGRKSCELIGKILKNQPKIGEWIPCSERLPEEKTNPITKNFYEYQVTFRNDDVIDIRHYKFGRGHWWNGPNIMDEYVTAWKPLPEPYNA